MLCRRKRLFISLIALSITATVFLTCQLRAYGQGMSGIVQTVPAQTRLARSGLSVTLDSEWPYSDGYAPVTVRIDSLIGPAKADRSLTLEFASSWNDQNRITRYVTLGQGETSRTTEILLPRPRNSNYQYFKLYENGREIPELTTYNPGNLGGHSSMQRVTVLVIEPQGAQQPLRQELSGKPVAFGRSNQAARQNPGQSLDVGSTPIERCRTRWMDYSGLDVVALTLPELRQLAQKNQPAFQAIRSWVATGGNLWVLEVGDQWQGLSELESLLEFSSVASDQPPEERGWTAHGPQEFVKWMTAAEPNQSLQQFHPAHLEYIKKHSPTVATRELQFGQILAMPDRGPKENTHDAWRYIGSVVGPERLVWHVRHGFSEEQLNEDFWNFLIEDFGLPPVVLFQFLITLFVLLIGPVNYLLLRKRRRLNFILVTVPAGAVLVTGGLLSYALLADGLGVQTRLRSVTLLDADGRAATWGRHCYYAGIAPSEGLQFPDEMLLYPLEYEPSGFRHRRGRPKHLHWGKENQTLHGYLTTRSPAQFTSVHAHQATGKIEVTQSSDGTPTAKNRLWADVALLALTDNDQQSYLATDVGIGETAKLEAVPTAEARQRLSELLAVNKPDVSSEIDLAMQHGSFQQYRGWVSPTGDRTPDQSSGRLEMTMDQVPDAILQGRCYVAVLRSSPEPLLGVNDADESAGFHVVVGNWRPQ